MTAEITDYGLVTFLNKNAKIVNFPFTSAKVVFNNGDLHVQYFNRGIPFAEESFFSVDTKNLVINFYGSGVVEVEV